MERGDPRRAIGRMDAAHSTPPHRRSRLAAEPANMPAAGPSEQKTYACCRQLNYICRVLRGGDLALPARCARQAQLRTNSSPPGPVPAGGTIRARQTNLPACSPAARLLTDLPWNPRLPTPQHYRCSACRVPDAAAVARAPTMACTHCFAKRNGTEPCCLQLMGQPARGNVCSV